MVQGNEANYDTRLDIPSSSRWRIYNNLQRGRKLISWRNTWKMNVAFTNPSLSFNFISPFFLWCLSALPHLSYGQPGPSPVVVVRSHIMSFSTKLGLIWDSLYLSCFLSPLTKLRVIIGTKFIWQTMVSLGVPFSRASLTVVSLDVPSIRTVEWPQVC